MKSKLVSNSSSSLFDMFNALITNKHLFISVNLIWNKLCNSGILESAIEFKFSFRCLFSKSGQHRTNFESKNNWNFKIITQSFKCVIRNLEPCFLKFLLWRTICESYLHANYNVFIIHACKYSSTMSTLY